MSLLSLTTATCTIERKATTSSASGGQVESFSTAYSDLPISLQPASGKLQERFARRSMIVSHVAYTPTAVTVLAGDRLVCGGLKYIVTSSGDMAGRGRAFAIYLILTD